MNHSFQDRVKHAASRLPAPSFLVTDAAGFFYLTGVNLEGAWLLVTKDGGHLFAPPLLAGQLRALLPGTDIHSGDKYYSLFIEFCKKNKIKTVGIDGTRVSYALATRLSKDVKLKNISDFNESLRIVKDEFEIDRLRQSCHLAARAFNYIKKTVRPGMTEIEIAYKIDEYFAKNQAKPSFTTIVASGPNSANPHHISESRRVQKNDIVLIDMGCVYKGYCSDLTRTLFLGKMNDLHKQVYTLVSRAKIEAQSRLKSGVKAKDIDTAARDVISRGGYGKDFVHTTGHGVGIDIHEPPRLSRLDTTVLKSGMVVTVEPGIYLEGRFGVRIEDTLLVTKKGSEVLTA